MIRFTPSDSPYLPGWQIDIRTWAVGVTWQSNGWWCLNIGPLVYCYDPEEVD